MTPALDSMLRFLAEQIAAEVDAEEAAAAVTVDASAREEQDSAQ